MFPLVLLGCSHSVLTGLSSYVANVARPWWLTRRAQEPYKLALKAGWLTGGVGSAARPVYSDALCT